MSSSYVRNRALATAVVASFAIGTIVLAVPQDPPAGLPPMPTASEHHLWLKKFVGQWDATAEVQMEPGAPPMTSNGVETVRPIGDFWIVAHANGRFMETEFDSVLTLGYDEEKKKFIGTWVDSFSGYMWRYEGTLDEARRTLTLETEGPGPSGEMIRFREITEFKSDDHRVFTSSMQEPDGTWNTFVTGSYRRRN